MAFGKEKLRADCRAANRERDYEKDRADALLQIVIDVNRTLLNGPVGVGAPARFFQEIERFRHEKTSPYLPDSRGLLNPRAVAKIVIKELGAQISEKSNFGKDIEQLEKRLNDFTSQTRREGGEAIQAPKKTGVENNELHDRQDDIDNLKNQISLLEGEKASLLEATKDRIEAARQELEAAHAVNIENLKTEHDERISDMERANASAENSLKVKYRSEKALRAECEGEIERLQTENNAQKATISELISRHQYEQNILREHYELDRKRLVGEMSEIKRNHDLALGQMEQMRRSSIKEQQKNQSTIREMEQRHQSTIRETDQRHQSAINNVELEYKSMIEQMQEDHELERARWQSTKEKIQRDYKAEMDLMQNEQDSETALMIQEHDAAITKMGREHESKQAQLINQISEMEKDHASAQEKMRKDHASAQEKMRKSFETRKRELEAGFKLKVEQVEMAHVEERKRLRKDVNAYSDALLARDKFTPKPDNEIKARFLDLVQDVDALARLEWKANQKEWTNQVLQSLSPNQRPLKKQILQDTIWVILHDSIFCSPFRIFGEEGQALETQWNGECGKDPRLDNGSYTWPEPAMETERWRYVTVKECRASLKQPVPSHWDPRAKLKRGFKTSIDALRKELTSMLEEIADLDNDWVQAIEKMTLKAATIWLEFGMQRCRISVVMQGSNLKSAQERIRRAQESSLKMVVLPELKRFGDSHGQDLNIEEVVGGCDGQIVEVSMGR